MTTTSISGGSITFGDGSSQSTAAQPHSSQFFTSSGTFTIPAGVTFIKVSALGGGGSSSGFNGCPSFVNVHGTSGGTSSVSSGTQSITTISATGGGYGQGYTALPNNQVPGAEIGRAHV